ncbi:hypothetical protein BLNAU_19944 [Blattamonas nauphoetae]|uniref:Uncharacterized protein n=1 Tax=Blattamonas nauphoetae TaxID=2049346 RepID=A0ABQ9X067_9EUKA|nr:hypothetical protein BLNAU_19944 [Blattamonas nauphoetae]
MIVSIDRVIHIWVERDIVLQARLPVSFIVFPFFPFSKISVHALAIIGMLVHALAIVGMLVHALAIIGMLVHALAIIGMLVLALAIIGMLVHALAIIGMLVHAHPRREWSYSLIIYRLVNVLRLQHCMFS